MGGTDGTIRVLYVDDDPSLGDMVATFLEREDDRITVQTAMNAEEGREILANDNIDCIISDYEMPGQNGIEFLEIVRDGYPDLPFILYTGKGSEEVASEAISVGVTDYLQKESGTDQYTILANRVTNAVAQTRAEREVIRTREYFGTILEHASDFVMVVNETGEVNYISPAVERVLGYTPDELEGVDSFERIHPADLSRASDAFADVLEHPDQEHTIEYRARHADGSWRWLEVRGRNRLDDPVIEGILVSARDITVRKAREQELRQKERRYQAVFNDPNILVGMIDTDGTVLDINETAMGYVDANEVDITGEPFWETPWFTGDETIQQEVRDWINQAAAGEYIEFEFDLSETVDEQLVINGFFRPVRDDDGKVVSLLISVRDITEQKERERELERYKAYLEESSDVIAVFDDSGRVKYESPAVSRILGYEQGELVGQNGFDFIHSDDEQEVYETFTQLLSEPGATATAEYRFRTADGQWCWLEARGTNHLDTDPINGIVTNNRDITDRKEREQKLRRRNERLDEFVSIVSHDLQNPLNVAEGRLELAREECDSEHLASVVRAHDRMNLLIDDLLDLARAGELVSETESIDLAALIEGSWQTVDTADATLQVKTTRRIEADRSRLQQLLENLFRNAIEHGGEDVTVTAGDLDDGFYIEDDGPGIPADERGEVFEAGYSSNPDGTGFGLSIVKQVAEAHNWEVRITNGTDGGARFEISGVDVDE